jgi:hypothetical protein
MPNYKAYRRRFFRSDPGLNRRFGELLAIETAPAGNPLAAVSEFAYFLPYWNRTQLGRGAANSFGFDGSQSLIIIVRCPTHHIHLIIDPSDVVIEDWLPTDFVKIGAETILKYFTIDPTVLAHPYTGSLPAILPLYAPKGCQPRPPAAPQLIGVP